MITDSANDRLRVTGSMKKEDNSLEPLVSIVTVCKNSEKYIEKTMRSVLDQTYKNIEYIVIDGGSTDNTVDIIKRYKDNIAYWISEPDRGAYDAMNKGIAVASGEWIGIINSDDWYAPDAVELIVAASLTRRDADVIYGNLLHVRMGDVFIEESNYDIDGKYHTRRASHENMLEKWALPHPACFIKRRNYEERKYDYRLKFSADYDLLLALYEGKKVFSYIPNAIAYYRPIGMTSTISYRSVLEGFYIRRKYNFCKALLLLVSETVSYAKAVFFFHRRKARG